MVGVGRQPFRTQSPTGAPPDASFDAIEFIATSSEYRKRFWASGSTAS